MTLQWLLIYWRIFIIQVAAWWSSSGDGLVQICIGLASPTFLLTQVTKSDLTLDAWPLGLVRVEWHPSGCQYQVIGEQFMHWLFIGPNDTISTSGHLFYSGIGLAHFDQSMTSFKGLGVAEWQWLEKELSTLL